MSCYEIDKDGTVRDFFSKRKVSPEEETAVIKTLSNLRNIRGTPRNIKISSEAKRPHPEGGANF